MPLIRAGHIRICRPVLVRADGTVVADSAPPEEQMTSGAEEPEQPPPASPETPGLLAAAEADVSGATRSRSPVPEQPRTDDDAPDAAGIRARAEAAGFAVGIRKAEEQTAEMLRELRRAIAAILDDAEEQREALVRSAEPRMVELALAEARRFGAAALDNPDELVAAVRATLARALGRETVRLRVASRDLQRVRGLEARLREAVSGLERVEIVEDTCLEAGVAVETADTDRESK